MHPLKCTPCPCTPLAMHPLPRAPCTPPCNAPPDSCPPALRPVPEPPAPTCRRSGSSGPPAAGLGSGSGAAGAAPRTPARSSSAPRCPGRPRSCCCRRRSRRATRACRGGGREAAPRSPVDARSQAGARCPPLPGDPPAAHPAPAHYILLPPEPALQMLPSPAWHCPRGGWGFGEGKSLRHSTGGLLPRWKGLRRREDPPLPTLAPNP